MTARTASDPVVIDSSGCLEYLTDGTKSEAFAPYLAEDHVVLVSTVVIYEVRKILTFKVLRYFDLSALTIAQPAYTLAN